MTEPQYRVIADKDTTPDLVSTQAAPGDRLVYDVIDADRWSLVRIERQVDGDEPSVQPPTREQIAEAKQREMDKWLSDASVRERAIAASWFDAGADTVLALFPHPHPTPSAEPHDHESVSPVDGTTWVQRNDGWQHVDVLDREVRLRRSPFHGLMVGVDGHWAYVGDDEARMRDYLNPESDQTAPQEEITMNSNGYIAPQTEDEQSEEDREALDQYDGPTELDSHDLPDDYEIEGDRG